MRFVEMNKIYLTPILLFTVNVALAQVEYKDQLIPNTIYSNASPELKIRKAFIREWVFFEERAYPDGFIPERAYERAVEQRNKMRSQKNQLSNSIIWSSLGPTPGYYPSYGNISSRIVTGTYDPSNPNIIYIGAANGGVWKSTDAGINWTPLTDNQPSMSLGAIAIDPQNPNIIYAGTGEATYSGVSYYGVGLLKSTNGGTTWQYITSGLPSFTYFSRLVIRPGYSNELLAALGNSGLYRSTNAGTTWFQLLAGRCDDVIFTASGDTAFAVGNGIGTQRSINGGASFSGFGSNLPDGIRTHFDLCLNSPATMYAAVYSSNAVKVYKSINNGVVWTQIAVSQDFDGGQAWYDLYCKVHPKNPNIVFVGTIDIYRSTNGGTSFTNITNGYSGGSVHVDQHNLFFHPTNENIFISCNDGGIYRSTDLGNSFTNLNQNLTLTQFYRIAASPFNPSRILGGTQDNGTQQTYGTPNWAAAFGGDGGEVCFNPFDANYILGETQNGGLRRTINGGTSWSSATSGISTAEAVAWVAPIIAHPIDNGTFYTARQRIYKSTSNGSSWTAISSNVNGTSAVRELAISRSNPLIMYATSSSKIFRSNNGGVNWINVTVGLPTKTITSVYVHPTNSDVAFATFSGFGTNKVYKTTNSGASWYSIHGNLPDSPVNDILIYPDDPDKIYFVATDVGVFLTTNGGIEWTEAEQDLPNTVAIHLDYSASTKMLRVGTHGRGVFEAFINFTGTSASFSTQAGWNLLSIPLQGINMHKDYLFPNSNSNAYGYNNGYFIVDTLQHGFGYWLKFPNSQNHNIFGDVINPLTIQVNSGWNIVGAMNASVQTSTVTTNPPGIISSSFFAYDNGYLPVSSLQPGKGHWIKTNSSGSMTFITTFGKNDTHFDQFYEYDKIIITDNDGREFNLFFTAEKINLDKFELPPPPPSGMPDVRFLSGKFVEYSGNESVISLDGISYPIKVAFRGFSNTYLEMKYLCESGEKIIQIENDKVVTISEKNVNRITINPISKKFSFALNQNYPNPFSASGASTSDGNSSTRISFSISKPSQVKLKIFNILGEEIDVLLDKYLTDGLHTIEVNSLKIGKLSSGIYLYQLQAEGQTAIRKMILFK